MTPIPLVHVPRRRLYPERPFLAALLLALAATLGGAPALRAQPSSRSLAWEAAGGTTGSLTGFGVGILVSEGHTCGEDLSCILEDVAVAVGAATVGAAVGAVLAGEASGGSPSRWGALLGSAAGAAAGLGVVKLLDEAAVSEETWGILAFGVSQGTVAALASWLLGR